MIENQNLIAGSVRSAKAAEVAVNEDASRIDQAAEVATTVIMQKFGDSIGATREEIAEVNRIGLQLALTKAADPDASTPKGSFIPVYFDSITKGMRVTLGRTVLNTVSDIPTVTLPGSYSRTVMLMKAAGIAFVRPHRPTDEASRTLALGKENIDGVDCITGNLESVTIDDLVRRGLITMSEEDALLLKTLSGELALNYGELDTLLVDYFASATRVSLS